MITLPGKTVSSVLIGKWWYRVVGDFTEHRGATSVEYSFKYYPRGDVFGSDPLVMHVSEGQIDAFKYDGDE